jgi:malonate transporter
VAGIFQAFFVITALIVAGALFGRTKFGRADNQILSWVIYFVLTPALLFSVIVKSDISVIVSPILVIGLLAALVCQGLYLLLAHLFFKESGSKLVIGSLAASWSNAGNIGIPVAIYVLGGAQYVAPVILMQIALLVPISAAVLDVITSPGKRHLKKVLLQPLQNPILIAAIAGLVVAFFRIPLPSYVIEPFNSLGNATVPLVLLLFGMAMVHEKPLRSGKDIPQMALASVIKLFAMPLVSWLLGVFVFHLSGIMLLAVTVAGALPTAQSVFTYASRYSSGRTLARDSALATTLLSIPVLLVITLLIPH